MSLPFDLQHTASKEQSAHHLILAHGAGAGCRHEFMETMRDLLIANGIHVWLFNFGYMQKAYAENKKIPPAKLPKLIAEYQTVSEHVIKAFPDSYIWVGGKSMGGRVACHLASQNTALQGVVALGYPFHPVGKPDNLRTEVLDEVKAPVFICQGERDTFGTREEVLGYQLKEDIQVAFFADADHSLKPRKASGWTQAQHLQAAAKQIATFIKAQS